MTLVMTRKNGCNGGMNLSEMNSKLSHRLQR